MRKTYQYPLFVAAALLLAMLTGCTLYMDEEEQVPEEQRGFEEPVHVQNDTVDVTYQFNEGTRVLTAHVQEYLVRVEADSILYFMDNTPQDYLPYAGGYVFSDCTDKLPWGLMHYVEQAGYVDGFYRVVCRDAAIKEVFKKFQLNIDRVVDYSKGRIVSMPDSMGSLLSDTVPEFETAPVNYTEYDDEGNEIGVPSLGRWSTRSDDDDDSDGNKDRSETSTFEFGFDSRNIVGGAGPEGFICKAMYGRVPNWLKGGMHFRGKKKNKFTVGGKDVGLESYKNLYWALKYTYTNTETTHVCIDSDRDFFEYYVDDETSHTFSVEAGYCAGVEGQWKPGRAVFEKIPKSKQTELLQTIDGPEIAIPLWGPVSLIINSSFDFDFHIAACGKFSYTRTTKKRKGMCYKDGSMERTDKLLESSSSNKVDFEVCGEAKAEISAHIGVGIRVGKGITLDGTFGGYVTAGVEVQASASLNDLIDNGGEKQPVSDRNFFHAYVKAGLELGLKVSFIGKSLYDQKYPVGKVLMLAEYKTCPYPEINYKGMKVTNLSGDDNSDFDFSDADFQLKMQYKNDFFPEANDALGPTLDLIDTQRQGIENGIKNAAAVRFLARLGQSMRPEDIKAEQKRFTEANLSIENSGGVMMVDTKYAEVKQLESKPFALDADQMTLIHKNVENYYGVNEKILRNEWDEQTWTAFYEGKIEVFALQMSLALVEMFFSDREQAAGNDIMFSANRLQFATLRDKIQTIQQLFDRGMLNRDEGREIMQMEPLPDGQGQEYYIRGEYISDAERAAIRGKKEKGDENDAGEL